MFYKPTPQLPLSLVSTMISGWKPRLYILTKWERRPKIRWRVPERMTAEVPQKESAWIKLTAFRAASRCSAVQASRRTTEVLLLAKGIVSRRSLKLRWFDPAVRFDDALRF